MVGQFVHAGPARQPFLDQLGRLFPVGQIIGECVPLLVEFYQLLIAGQGPDLLEECCIGLPHSHRLIDIALDGGQDLRKLGLEWNNGGALHGARLSLVTGNWSFPIVHWEVRNVQ